MKTNASSRESIIKTITCECPQSNLFVIMKRIVTAKNNSKQSVITQYKVFIELEFL